jgi:NADH-quinone oxidoreductase subunit L
VGSSTILWLSLAVLTIPLLSALICFIINEKFAWLAPLASSILLLTALICSIILFSKINHQDPFIKIWPWMTLGVKAINLNLFLNDQAASMAMVVTLISFLVHIYSIGYMAEDHAQIRYFGMLGFFTFAMIGIVLSGNLLIIFFFWELVGFSSYRLIAHWYEKNAASRAGTKGFLINRVGDLGFLIGIMILWAYTGNLDITDSIIKNDPLWLTASGLLIFWAVIGKSAQFPLLNWLPDAMEGPTPVSALIHAATMVAAGVYLLVRLSFMLTPTTLIVISIIGSITALIGAIGALYQLDIKKILAYSTISQLGFMVMAIGSGSLQGGFLHLLNHAFFKAGLFLGAGAIIHATHQTYHHSEADIDVQDIRNMGGLRKKLPITFFTFLVCSSAIAGIPFTSGFISKEIILTQMNSWAGSGMNWHWMVMVSAWIITLLTPIYTFRLVWYSFIAKPKMDIKVEEVPGIMQLPMILLALLSLAIFFSSGSFGLTSLTNRLLTISIESNHIITIISVIIISIALAIAYWFFVKKKVTERQLHPPHYYLDFISGQSFSLTKKISQLTLWIDKNVIDTTIHWLAYIKVVIAHIAGWTDQRIIDGLVNGVAYSSKGIGTIARSIVNGKIQSYLLWALAGLVIFIFWFLF